MNATAVQPVPSLRALLAERWQIPTFIAGLGVLASGLLHIASANHPLSFDEQMLLARRLCEQNRNGDASGYLKDLLAQPERSDGQRAALHMMLAWTIHRAESRLLKHGRANAEAITSNFERAVRLGRQPGCDEWTFAADAYAWLQEDDQAVAAWRHAIEGGSARGAELRKKIVEIRSRFGGALTDEALAELDAILEDPSAGGELFAWALERKAEWLFDQGRHDDCIRLVEAARARKQDDSLGDLVAYLEARGLIETGRLEEAQTQLRALRDRRPTRDELWGQAGRLLGNLELRDDRPQSALAFYEDVLQSYPRGDLHDACQLGRAQALAALERHDEAMSEFAEIADTLSVARYHRHLSKNLLRTAMTAIGQSLTDKPAAPPEDVAAGINYLRRGLDWFGLEDRLAELPMLERIAIGLRGLAAAAERGAFGADDPMRATRLHEEAAEAYVKLSRLQNEDDAAASDSVWRAIEEYATAGRRDRVIALLEQFNSERPTSPLRARALHTLGQAYQAEGRFDEAARTYDLVIADYLPLPNALASLVPMAQCLIQQGGDKARQGVKILVDIVDDRGPVPLFTPQAREYRQALFLLARYYLRADDKTEPRHLELAIERLQDAKGLYPDDPETPEWTFHLGDSYRLSALALRRSQQVGATSAPSTDPRTLPDVSERTRAEADRRMTAALRYYEEVIGALAVQDEGKLSDTQKAWLRLSYLYRGDCLFDLGQYGEAREAYEEAAWRYANSPACVSASMQIYHCLLRLGRPDEARATLGRLKWLIATIPAESFAAERGLPGKAFWVDMIARLERLDEAGARQ